MHTRVPQPKSRSQYQALTKTERLILIYFSSFRFLTSSLIQQLLNHKSKSYIIHLLQHLRGLNIITLVNKEEVEKNFVSSIYSLTPLAKKPLVELRLRRTNQLQWIYKEGVRSRFFIQHQMKLCSLYITLRMQFGTNGKILHFYTKIDLQSFSALPHPKPDAMITSQKKGMKKQYYFLYLLDSGMPYKIHYGKIQSIVDLHESGEWQENVSEVFPVNILLCQDYGVQQKVQTYITSLDTDEIRFSVGRADEIGEMLQ